jgi:hypothetical protein
LDSYIHYESIKDWDALARAYLAVDELAGAFRAWTHFAEEAAPAEVIKAAVAAFINRD